MSSNRSSGWTRYFFASASSEKNEYLVTEMTYMELFALLPQDLLNICVEYYGQAKSRAILQYLEILEAPDYMISSIAERDRMEKEKRREIEMDMKEHPSRVYQESADYIVHKERRRRARTIATLLRVIDDDVVGFIAEPGECGRDGPFVCCTTSAVGRSAFLSLPSAIKWATYTPVI